ncbi:FHA domain-containing protein [Acaryochloris sp. IP29b_bin.137]|uniref:FHA domain-containing protein n=1 Tax=Acaryochloris sp. IP29b_bin.137 TaxID=2969217 RepID=UPI002616D888|nr:FHA domain-containing protein [Acaryochloris sp. IP29b_bin.137]
MIATSLGIPQLLIQTEQSREPFEFKTGSEWTVGRHPNNPIQLSDRCASRQHAKLVSLVNQHFCYVDLNSRNGSKHNGRSVKQPVWLQHGDRIKIGDTSLIFQDIPAHRTTGNGTPEQAQVLLLQADALQGKIWQTILRSQTIDSFWESPDIDLKAYLPRCVACGSLPQLLILDTQVLGAQTYGVTAWCAQTFPQLHIIVNNSQERQILMSERQKAAQAGCLNWFPAFREPKLMDNVAGIVVQVNGVMNILGGNLRQDQLFSVLQSFETLLSEVERLQPPPKSVKPHPAQPSNPAVQNGDLTQVTHVRRKG